MKTVLITRPAEDAAVLAGEMHARGFEPLLEPLLKITPMAENQPLLQLALARNPQLILASSRSAIRLLAGMAERRDIPLLPVGLASGEFARTLGFTVPPARCETADALLAFVAQHYKPTGGRILYVRGADITVDMADELAHRGFIVDSVTLYHAVKASALSDHVVREIKLGHIAGALFFSRRTAETYASLVALHRLTSSHRYMRAVCISQVVGEILKPLPWKSFHIAASPELAQMVVTAEKFI